jgi:hypothetical protein
MKKLLSTLILTVIFTTVFSQSDSEAGTTCYHKYASVFEKRGAYEVEDGTYSDVIITLRQGTMADCFYGKVNVKDGTIDYKNMYLTFEDGTYEKLEYKFRYQAKPIKIVNGISTVILTEEDQLINVLFVKKIKPKKKQYKKAADPNFDF